MSLAFSVSFSFCYCFYKGFIQEIILVSRFLSFILISFPLKVFKFDTEILCDSCAFTKNFEQTSTEYSFFMSDFISHVCLQ